MTETWKTDAELAKEREERAAKERDAAKRKQPTKNPKDGE